jgi:hypothetical protein
MEQKQVLQPLPASKNDLSQAKEQISSGLALFSEIVKAELRPEIQSVKSSIEALRQQDLTKHDQEERQFREHQKDFASKVNVDLETLEKGNKVLESNLIKAQASLDGVIKDVKALEARVQQENASLNALKEALKKALV